MSAEAIVAFRRTVDFVRLVWILCCNNPTVLVLMNRGWAGQFVALTTSRVDRQFSLSFSFLLLFVWRFSFPSPNQANACRRLQSLQYLPTVGTTLSNRCSKRAPPNAQRRSPLSRPATANRYLVQHSTVHTVPTSNNSTSTRHGTHPLSQALSTTLKRQPFWLCHSVSPPPPPPPCVSLSARHGSE